MPPSREVKNGLRSCQRWSIPAQYAHRASSDSRKPTLLLRGEVGRSYLGTRGTPAVRNVAVCEWNDHIIFLRKIIPGAADKSYGIQVARLAGLPQPIIERAKEILAKLEAPNAPLDAVSTAPAQEYTVATVKKPRAKKTASAEVVGGPVSRQVELELF